jgi:hypothetical protein
MVASPPASGGREAWIWLSAVVVSSAGAELASAVVNPTHSEIGYGVQWVAERWDGREWVPAGTWTFSLDQWGGLPLVGGPVATTSSLAVPAIRLVAGPNAVGPVQYFTMAPMSEGRYRVGFPRNGGTGIFGEIRVVSDAPSPVPVENPRPPMLLVAPTIMRDSREIRLYGLPENRDGHTSFDDVHRFNQDMATSIILQRWDGGGWDVVTRLPVGPVSEALHNPEEVAVSLPYLSTGAYRITRGSPSGALARVIWIDESLVG